MGVFQVVDWPTVLRRISYRRSRGRTLYDLHPVEAGATKTAPAALNRSRVEFLMDPAQRDLQRDWAFYLSLLLPLHHRGRTEQGEWTVPLGETLRDHAARLLAGSPTRAALRAHRRVTRAAFVADAHGLRIAFDGVAAVVKAVGQLREAAAA
jgi:hypothetical protein